MAERFYGRRPGTRLRSLFVSLAAVGLCATPAFAGLVPASLRCESRPGPLGVDAAQPRLGWILQAGDPNARGQRQTAYRVIVASSAAGLAAGRGDLWDSGRVPSDQTVGIAYGGKALRSSQRVFWKVQAWDGNRAASVWSARAEWTEGVLRPADWGPARWINSPALDPAQGGTLRLRRGFAVRPGLKRALVHVCGLGQYEMSLNGRKIGDDLLTPGWTDYKKTCLYDTYDVTALLKPGPNAAGLFLGDGMYNVAPGRYTKFVGSFGPLKAIALLRLEYRDGSTQTLGTDRRWRVTPGPITFSSPYGGEDYDARQAAPGWDRPGFDDARWAAAQETGGPGGALRGLSYAAPPVRAFDALAPVGARQISPGVAVYDLGRNASLMPRLTVQGTPGASVRLIPAELVKADGSVDRGSVGGGLAYWQYTLAGTGRETYFPRFFYHGCRYLQVERTAGPDGERPTVVSLRGVVIHSASPPAGRFSCSSDLFNRVSVLVRRAQENNMESLLTDCPHRERLGWLEQDHLNGPALRDDFDLSALTTKITNDMADAQTETGLVPSIAPEYVVFRDHPDGVRNDFGDSPEWGSAFLLVPWQQYQWTGDLDLLRRHYDGMKRYVAYLGGRAQGDIVDYGLGDWYDLGPGRPGRSQLTPRALTATAFFYADTDVLAQTAALLGRPAEATRYRTQAAQIAAAFNLRFYDPATGQYATGSQCANALPLVLGLAAPEHRRAVLDAIVRDVQNRGNAFTAGDIGYHYLLRALADGGRSDVIFAMNNQSDKPGYGFQLKRGATSLTEAWDAAPRSSQDHFMLGQIVEWFYHDLAGLQGDPSSPGFSRIVIKPAPVAGIAWARADYASVHGPIVSAWKRQGERLTLDVTLPPNTTATVFVPTRNAAGVTESGRPAARSPGVAFLRAEPGAGVYRVGSGHYVFSAAPPLP